VTLSIDVNKNKLPKSAFANTFTNVLSYCLFLRRGNCSWRIEPNRPFASIGNSQIAHEKMTTQVVPSPSVNYMIYPIQIHR